MIAAMIACAVLMGFALGLLAASFLARPTLP